MKTVIVASKNPVKIDATKIAFEKMFSGEKFVVEGISVSSGVSDQPMTSDETYKGALNRATSAKSDKSDADYWVGLEGGLEKRNLVLEAFAWIAVMSKDKTGIGKTASFFLPEVVAELVREGKELGDATDEIFDEDNSKQNMGTIGLLTENNIDRTKYYVDALVIALIPFKNPDFY